MSEQSHRSDPQVLNRRTLDRDHRVLAAMLRPGMSVLDVGCGTGAITAGIARAIGPEGRAVGVDRDEALLAIATGEYGGISNLTFQRQDAVSMPFDGVFDLVTAARALQWIGDPALALRRMRAAAKPGGSVVALDYNHEKNAWEPDPPAEFARFYAAFLAWRAANHWDNRIADHLPGLFHDAGIDGVRTIPSDEIVERGAAGFAGASAIWGHVIATIGPRIVAAGHLGEEERLRAAAIYQDYVETRLERQTLSMQTVAGERRGV